MMVTLTHKHTGNEIEMTAEKLIDDFPASKWVKRNMVHVERRLMLSLLHYEIDGY